MRLGRLAIVALVISSSAGCGTMHNLFAPPPEPPGTYYALPSGIGLCVPFGGVGRSGLLATIGTIGGPIGIVQGDIKLARGDSFEESMSAIGGGLWMTGCGLAAIVDTPLSLVGDVVTLPIAYARYKNYPWATWWNADGTRGCLIGRLWPTPPDDDEKTQEQLEAAR